MVDDTRRSDSEYNYLFKLELGFFEVLRVLVKRSNVPLTIPETFIFGFGFSTPTLLCTDYSTGLLKVREGISHSSVFEACKHFEDMTNRRGGLPVAVHKLASTTFCKDIVTPMFTANEAFSCWNQFFCKNRAQVLQRFVMAGFKYSSLIKTTWDGRSVHKQVIANTSSIVGHSYSTQGLHLDQLHPDFDDVRRRCFVLRKTEGVKKRSVRTAAVIDTRVLSLVTLMEQYYLPSPELKIALLEADFMEDEKGVVYLIAVKNYRLSRGVDLSPERPLKESCVYESKASMPTEETPRHVAVKLPPIHDWKRALAIQAELLSLAEAHNKVKLNKSVLMG